MAERGPRSSSVMVIGVFLEVDDQCEPAGAVAFPFDDETGVGSWGGAMPESHPDVSPLLGWRPLVAASGVRAQCGLGRKVQVGRVGETVGVFVVPNRLCIAGVLRLDSGCPRWSHPMGRQPSMRGIGTVGKACGVAQVVAVRELGFSVGGGDLLEGWGHFPSIEHVFEIGQGRRRPRAAATLRLGSPFRPVTAGNVYRRSSIFPWVSVRPSN